VFGYVRRLFLMLVTLFGSRHHLRALLSSFPQCSEHNILFMPGRFVASIPPTWPSGEGARLHQPILCNILQWIAACCTAISAIPTWRRSRRWDEICRRFPITARSCGAGACFPARSASLGVIRACIMGTRLDYALRRGQLKERLCRCAGPSFGWGLLDPDGVGFAVRARPRFNPTRRP